MTRIEHINITVPDIEEAINFLKIVAPDFVVRKDSKSIDNYRWVHIGNNNCYIALQEAHLGEAAKKQLPSYKNFGINHIALVVINLKEIEDKLDKNGYQKGIETLEEKYRKRRYYYDHAGFEWELVQYLSEKADEMYLFE